MHCYDLEIPKNELRKFDFQHFYEYINKKNKNICNFTAPYKYTKMLFNIYTGKHCFCQENTVLN